MRQLIDINGVRLNVIIEGEGPEVLLVHGFPDDHSIWRHQISALVAAGYKVIAPDTRGCGDSDMPSEPQDYRMELLVDDLRGLLDALQIKQVKLVAHDWGSLQAWHFALRHPERVSQYITLSVGHPTAYSRGGLEQKLRGYYIFFVQMRGLSEWLATRMNWLLFKIMTHYPPEFAHWRDKLSRPGRLTAGLNYYRANFSSMLSGRIGDNETSRAQMPVVGVWSSRDSFLAQGQIRDSGRYCDAGFQYERIDGASHWMQLDAPDTLNALLLKHLGRTK